ncbi:MAG TPA: MraY family glycosyltransferase [Patescibacteria group bacterium]|nr:MraY family glycosyltransferase [Patescibacteria group bacterium]
MSTLASWAPFIVSFVLSVLGTPLVILLYRKMHWLDDPRKNPHPKMVHSLPLPRGGGIPIFLSIATAVLLFIPFSKQIAGLLGGALVLTVLGIWDDLKNPHPLLRFIILIIAALIVIGSGVGIAYITNPFGGIVRLDQPQLAFILGGSLHTIWIIADIFALVWIVWCMNIVNFATGLDGQMPGYVAIASGVIGLLALRFGSDPTQIRISTLSMIVAGAYIGLLLWNMYPQKIIAGFGASTLAGFFLSVMAIFSGAKLATAILVLAVPMIDASIVILWRLAHGRSPFFGDRSHLHHLLLDSGWSKRQVALFYWVATAIFGLFSLQLKSGQKVFIITLAIAIIGGIIVWLRYSTTFFAKSGRGNG